MGKTGDKGENGAIARIGKCRRQRTESDICRFALWPRFPLPMAPFSPNDMKWTQGFVGQGSRISTDYGVASIPQIMLIGPDGKVIARDLVGPGIKAVVSQALGHRPGTLRSGESAPSLSKCAGPPRETISER
jgi:hypothetical protein